MTNTDQKEDEVLKRMLKTPPKTHDKGKALKKAREPKPEKASDQKV